MSDPGGIEYNEIARRDQTGEIGELSVLQGTIRLNAFMGTSYDQQATRSPVRRWFLSDELGGKIVLEIGGTERFRRQRWSLERPAA